MSVTVEGFVLYDRVNIQVHTEITGTYMFLSSQREEILLLAQGKNFKK